MKMSKRIVAVLLGFCMLWGLSLGCLAEPDEGETPETTTSESAEEPTTTEEEPVATTTTEEQPGEGEPTLLQLDLKIVLVTSDGLVEARVTDSLGRPVEGAAVVFRVDGADGTGYTDANGVVQCVLSATAHEVMATVASFHTDTVQYNGTAGSIVLSQSPSEYSTQPLPTTTLNTTTSSRLTGPITTATTVEGGVAAVTTDEATPTTDSGEDDSDGVTYVGHKTDHPRGWALVLMIAGGVLIVGAAVLCYFWLIRKPRDEQAEPAAEVPSARAVTPAVQFPTDKAESTPSAEKTPSKVSAVSLENLFGDDDR